MNLATLLGVGAAFGACVAIGVFAGVLADHEWGTSPLLALLGLTLGILGGAAGAYQVIRPFTRSSTPQPPKLNPPDLTTLPTDDRVRSDEQ